MSDYVWEREWSVKYSVTCKDLVIICIADRYVPYACRWTTHRWLHFARHHVHPSVEKGEYVTVQWAFVDIISSTLETLLSWTSGKEWILYGLVYSSSIPKKQWVLYCLVASYRHYVNPPQEMVSTLQFSGQW